MSDVKNLRLASRIIHAGQRTCPLTGAVSTPIYQTSTFAFKDADEGRGPLRRHRSGLQVHPPRQPHRRGPRGVHRGAGRGLRGPRRLDGHGGRPHGLLRPPRSRSARRRNRRPLRREPDDPRERVLPVRCDGNVRRHVRRRERPRRRCARRRSSSTSSRRRTRRSSCATSSAIAEIAHRHGALVAVDNTFASPASPAAVLARRGRHRPQHDEVHQRPQRRRGGDRRREGPGALRAPPQGPRERRPDDGPSPGVARLSAASRRSA